MKGNAAFNAPGFARVTTIDTNTGGGTTTTTVYRGAFTRVDARLSRALMRGVDAQVGVTNAFDAKPVAWPGTTDRRAYVGVKIDRQF